MPFNSFLMAGFAVLLSFSGVDAQVQITGRVLDKAAMRPVPGATVRLKGYNLNATTDSLGRFTLSGNPVSVQPRQIEWTAPMMDRNGLRFRTLTSHVEVQTSLFDTQGKTISFRSYSLDSPGMHVLPVLDKTPANFIGFLRVRAGEETYRLKVFRSNTPVPTSEARFTFTPAALAKPSAAGDSVVVSITGLITKSVSAPSNADLGDIVLDYPPRTTIGVGAPRPYGAIVLFDGTKGPGAAQAELLAKWFKWRDWTSGAGCAQGATSTKNTSPPNFKIAKDPEFPNDTNRVTLRSDFVTGTATRWGCDDIEAKPALYAHGDAQIHAEWMAMGVYDSTDRENPNTSTTYGTTATATYYVNSGVYVQNRYEIQIQSAPIATNITDCHYMGSIVDEYAPSAATGRGATGTACTSAQSPCPNCIPSNQLVTQNGVWNSYDITFRTSRWNGTTRSEYGYMTMWWNGKLVHSNRLVTAVAGGTNNTSGENMDSTKYGVKLQRERGDVRFRNVWFKHLKIDSTNTLFGY